MIKKGIIGIGGFSKELFYSMDKSDQSNTVFFCDDEYYHNQPNTFPLSEFDKEKYEVIIALGENELRESIVEKLPKKTKFFTFIHPSAQIFSSDVEIGEGSIICANSVLRTNIKLGKHSQLDRNTHIGHDCVIGDYFRMSPNSIISGNCNIGKHVYFGTNSSVREKITICDNVTIGLNSGVVKDIKEHGTYIGLPAKKSKY